MPQLLEEYEIRREQEPESNLRKGTGSQVQVIPGIVQKVECEVQEVRKEFNGRIQDAESVLARCSEEIDKRFNEEIYNIRDGLQQMNMVTTTIRLKEFSVQTTSV